MMDNKIIGALFMILALVGTMTHALLFDDSPGQYSLFLSWPSFLLVFGGGTGIILMRKHTYQDNQLGKNLKREFILAGWIGFMIGLVLLFAGFSDEAWMFTSFQKIIHFGSPAIVPVYYGYIIGAMVEPFFTKERAPVLLKTSEEEE